MIVDDLDFGRSLICPHEADAPTGAQSARMLSGPGRLQRLEVMPGGNGILEDHGGIECRQLARVRFTKSAGKPLPKPRSATALRREAAPPANIMRICIAVWYIFQAGARIGARPPLKLSNQDITGHLARREKGQRPPGCDGRTAGCAPSMEGVGEAWPPARFAGVSTGSPWRRATRPAGRALRAPVAPGRRLAGPASPGVHGGGVRHPPSAPRPAGRSMLRFRVALETTRSPVIQLARQRGDTPRVSMGQLSRRPRPALTPAAPSQPRPLRAGRTGLWTGSCSACGSRRGAVQAPTPLDARPPAATSSRRLAAAIVPEAERAAVGPLRPALRRTAPGGCVFTRHRTLAATPRARRRRTCWPSRCPSLGARTRPQIRPGPRTTAISRLPDLTLGGAPSRTSSRLPRPLSKPSRCHGRGREPHRAASCHRKSRRALRDTSGG